MSEYEFIYIQLGRPSDDGAYICLETQVKVTPASAAFLLCFEAQKQICLGR